MPWDRTALESALCSYGRELMTTFCVTLPRAVYIWKKEDPGAKVLAESHDYANGRISDKVVSVTFQLKHTHNVAFRWTS